MSTATVLKKNYFTSPLYHFVIPKSQVLLQCSSNRDWVNQYLSHGLAWGWMQKTGTSLVPSLMILNIKHLNIPRNSHISPKNSVQWIRALEMWVLSVKITLIARSCDTAGNWKGTSGFHASICHWTILSFLSIIHVVCGLFVQASSYGLWAFLLCYCFSLKIPPTSDGFLRAFFFSSFSCVNAGPPKHCLHLCLHLFPCELVTDLDFFYACYIKNKKVPWEGELSEG